jgi:hypothetical protein
VLTTVRGTVRVISYHVSLHVSLLWIMFECVCPMMFKFVCPIMFLNTLLRFTPLRLGPFSNSHT